MRFCKFVILLAVTLLMSFPLFSVAKSPVFKVSDGDDYVYIGGTIHLLSADDYPLPESFDRAFNDAQQVFFEVDGSQLQLPETQVEMAGILTFQDGRTIDQVLDKEVYELLVTALAERNLPIAAFSSLTPAGISLTLTVFELQRLGLGNPANGVDHFFQLKTMQDASKELGFLETIEEQIQFIGELNNVDPNRLIRSSLEDLSALQQSWNGGLEAWRKGNLEGMVTKLGVDDMEVEFPSIYKALLTNRNQHWITQIEPMFATPDIEFVLVGAMHLVGSDSVITLLRDLGYQVEQLD